uniref:Uncharacterized protein n=1 Tax=Spongospora subterranea TaxID=70186 RepID=A0A0H5R9T9_9EUKA|eukprot:CRZ10556.1 hypothetical protein [Spongospora subterranea]
MDGLRRCVERHGGFVHKDLIIVDNVCGDLTKRTRAVYLRSDPGAVLSPEQEFLSIPRSGLLTAENCRIAQIISDLTEQYPITEWDQLILALIFEDTHRPSPWDEYLNFLPSTLNSPLFWTSSERDLLSFTAASSSIGHYSIEDGFHERIAPIFSSHPDLFPSSFDQYKRFGALIMAYSFTIADQIAMVPVADALNHISFSSNAKLFGDDAESVSMEVVTALLPGQELINTYGDVGNDTLLVRYGFMDSSDNPFTQIAIQYCQLSLSAMAYERTDEFISVEEDDWLYLRWPKSNVSIVDQIPDEVQMLIVADHVSEQQFQQLVESETEMTMFDSVIMRSLVGCLKNMAQSSPPIPSSSSLSDYIANERLWLAQRLRHESDRILHAWIDALIKAIV